MSEDRLRSAALVYARSGKLEVSRLTNPEEIAITIIKGADFVPLSFDREQACKLWAELGYALRQMGVCCTRWYGGRGKEAPGMCHCGLPAEANAVGCAECSSIMFRVPRQEA